MILTIWHKVFDNLYLWSIKPFFLAFSLVSQLEIRINLLGFCLHKRSKRGGPTKKTAEPRVREYIEHSAIIAIFFWDNNATMAVSVYCDTNSAMVSIIFLYSNTPVDVIVYCDNNNAELWLASVSQPCECSASYRMTQRWSGSALVTHSTGSHTHTPMAICH